MLAGMSQSHRFEPSPIGFLAYTDNTSPKLLSDMVAWLSEGSAKTNIGTAIDKLLECMHKLLDAANSVLEAAGICDGAAEEIDDEAECTGVGMCICTGDGIQLHRLANEGHRHNQGGVLEVAVLQPLQDGLRSHACYRLAFC